jgi:trans-aconitate methyltransferase
MNRWDPARYAANAAFVPELGAPLLSLLAPRAGERILDLGCGDGVLTAQIAATGARVIGVDASPEMVAAARARGLDARVHDAAALPFSAEVDACFSNAAMHWVRDQRGMLAGVRRALVAGGRFVAEMGGHGNIAPIVVALTAALRHRGRAVAEPWFFPSDDEYAELLGAHGFAVEQLSLFARPTPLPTGVRGWLDTFGGPFLNDLDEGLRGELVDEVEALLRPAICDARGRWTAPYVRLRFVARAR